MVLYLQAWLTTMKVKCDSMFIPIVFRISMGWIPIMQILIVIMWNYFPNKLPSFRLWFHRKKSETSRLKKFICKLPLFLNWTSWKYLWITNISNGSLDSVERGRKSGTGQNIDSGKSGTRAAIESNKEVPMAKSRVQANRLKYQWTQAVKTVRKLSF